MLTLLLSTVFLAASVHAEPTAATPKADVVPDVMFVRESSPFLFRIREQKPDAKLALIQTDANGEKLRYIGLMVDDGVMGDELKNDGTFSRKFQMTEKKAGPLFFAIVDETKLPPGVADGKTQTAFKANPDQILRIEILARPSFVELVGKSFNKLFRKAEAPAAVKSETDHGTHP